MNKVKKAERGKKRRSVFFCHAQPKPQLSWAEFSLIPSISPPNRLRNRPTHRIGSAPTGKVFQTQVTSTRRNEMRHLPKCLYEIKIDESVHNCQAQLKLG